MFVTLAGCPSVAYTSSHTASGSAIRDVVMALPDDVASATDL
ncbi:hypothetical protein [Pseudonocardia sp.]|nr:hypothetical protein [Pseudonocardia sp.]